MENLSSDMANEKPGGHGERSVAVGVLDMALWDLAAKVADVPLYRLLADRWHSGKTDDQIFVYAAGGYYYPGKGLKELQNEMRSYLERGYRVCKMKIGNGLDEDIPRIEAVLEIVGDGENLAVDANGRSDLDTASSYAEALKPYNLFCGYSLTAPCLTDWSNTSGSWTCCQITALLPAIAFRTAVIKCP